MRSWRRKRRKQQLAQLYTRVRPTQQRALHGLQSNCGVALRAEQGYDAAAASGRLGQPAQPVPPYGAGTGGGPQIGATADTADEDKDDAEFVKAAAARGITIKLGAHGEYTSESKT